MEVKITNISVVIATLGGASIYETIRTINNGSIIPTEILICIPIEFNKIDMTKLSFDNIKIIETKEKGQVLQRIIGFQNTICEFVLQIDDDVILEYNCLEQLYNSLTQSDLFTSISPCLFTIKTNLSVYRSSRKIVNKYILRPFYYLLINGFRGYKQGTITLAGTQIGIDPSNFENKLIKSEWLPGGCVLHNKNNLVLKNYFPFNGKAYMEDLYHSTILKRNKINLYINKQAIAYIDDPRDEELTFSSWKKEISNDFFIRKNLVKITNKSYFHLYMYYTIRILQFLVKNLIIKTKF
jgi:hypothetical protein